jgi:23S rRNA (uracil1939-C5)-methyltransferase
MNSQGLEQIIRSHPSAREGAVAPRCAHFGTCGGCDLQDVSHSAQLDGKTTLVSEMLRAYEGLEAVPVQRALGPTTAWEYRNKIEMTFGAGPEGVTLGFAPKRKFHAVVNVLECQITPRRLVDVAAAVREFAREHDLPAYDNRTHEGLLRNLVIREGRRTGDLVVNLVCASADWPREEFAAAMQQFRPTGVMWTLNRQVSNAVKFDAVEVLQGSEKVSERIMGLTLSFSPQSFFQTNTVMAEIMCRAVVQAAGEGEERALDAYCGVGTFSLLLSRTWASVAGVEIVEQAIADAIANAERNSVRNAAFVCRAAEDYQWSAGQFALVVLDPPRAGCHTRVIRRLLENRPRAVICVSCNAASLAADLARLQEGYIVESVQPIDMFPQTVHVECVAVLSAK